MTNREENAPQDAVVNEKPSIGDTVQALQNFDLNVPSRTLVYGLSALTPSEFVSLEGVWSSLEPETRKRLLNDLTETNELNVDLDYQLLGFVGLDDIDGDVRAAAIELLWENESPAFMERLINMAQWDDSYKVRAVATSALGRFILLGEYGSLSEIEAGRLQDVVISLVTNNDEDVIVRRRALEAIANSSHEIVSELIQEAYTGMEQEMKASAIFAMGRSCDLTWEDIILREMKSDEPEMRYEAARSAGELELSEAVSSLARLAVEDEQEVKEVAIWSLGEIGGREAMRLLNTIAQEAEESGDENLLEAIEDAIGNASLVGSNDFDL